MKKFLLLVLTAVSAICAAIGFSGCYIDDMVVVSDGTFIYSYRQSQTYCGVVGCEKSVSGEISIPYEYDGLPVTAVYSLGKTELISGVTIHKDITYISADAFKDLSSLENITVDGENKNFRSADGILYDYGISTLLCIPDGNKAENYTVPQSVTKIGAYAIGRCKNLKSVNVHAGFDNLEKIFKNCVSLENISVASDDKNYSSENGVLFNKDLTELMFYPVNKKDKSFTVPETVYKISFGAFEGVKNLEKLTLHFIGHNDDANRSDSSHFGYIFGAETYSQNERFVPRSLNTVNITGGFINSYAFAGCTAIEEINVSGNASLYSCIFDNCTGLRQLSFGENVNFHNYFIGEGTASLESIKLPYLYGTKFSDLFNFDAYVPYSLKNVEVMGGDIPSWYFYDCKYIERVTINEGVTSLGFCAFRGCKALSEINYFMGENKAVYDKESAPFINAANADGGATINLNENIKEINDNLFRGMGQIAGINFPEQSLTRIGDFAFASSMTLTELNIPDSVTELGQYAFGRYLIGGSENSIETLTLGKNLKTIKGYGRQIPAIVVFPSLKVLNFNCENLDDPDLTTYPFINAGKNSDGVTLNIGKAVTRIPDHIFEFGNIKNVTFADGSPCAIGRQAFGSTTIEAISLPSRVTSLGSQTFTDCTLLKNVSFYASTENILTTTFNNCTALESITAVGEGNYKTVDGVLFNEDLTELILYPLCKADASYQIPEGVKIIGGSSFYKAKKLTDITFPAGLEEIKGLAFCGCSALKDVNLPDGVNTLTYRAFADCTSLETAIIPASVRIFGYSTFDGCTSLKIYYTGTEEQKDLMLRNGQNPEEYGVPLLPYSTPNLIEHISRNS